MNGLTISFSIDLGWHWIISAPGWRPIISKLYTLWQQKRWVSILVPIAYFTVLNCQNISVGNWPAWWRCLNSKNNICLVVLVSKLLQLNQKDSKSGLNLVWPLIRNATYNSVCFRIYYLPLIGKQDREGKEKNLSNQGCSLVRKFTIREAKASMAKKVDIPSSEFCRLKPVLL